MTIRISSGLRAGMMTVYGFQYLMEYGRIDVYTGEPPSSADQPPTGTRVAQITNNGDAFLQGTTQGGLRLVSDVRGSVTKSGVWLLRGLATGTAGWFRFKWNARDDNVFSETVPRIDGRIGEDLFLPTTNMAPHVSFELSDFRLTLLAEQEQ